MKDNTQSAAEMAAWLIDSRGVKRNTAVIIGCNKFKVPFSFRASVSKMATQIIKSKQMRLI